MRGPPLAAVWLGPLWRLCSPLLEGSHGRSRTAPTRGLATQEAFRVGPGDGAPWVEGPSAVAAGLLGLLLTLLGPCLQPRASGWVPTGLGLQRGLGATAGRPGVGCAGDTNPSRSVWCTSACLGDLWTGLGCAPGPPAARPRGQAWAGQGRGQPTHQSAQRGLSAGATKTPRLLVRGPEQSWVPEALAVDPWRPERLRERNMEAITLRAVVWVIPKETPGPVLSKPGAWRPNEAIKAGILRL